MKGLKKLVVFFSVTFVVFLFMRILFEYYIPEVPTFEVLLTPLTWLCVVFAILAALFVVLIVIKAFKRKKDDEE